MKKVIFLVMILISLSLFSQEQTELPPIYYIGCDGYLLSFDSPDVQYWENLINDVPKSPLFFCLPNNWRNAFANFDVSDSRAIIICDELVEAQPHDSGECVCAGHSKGDLIFRSKAKYEEMYSCCNCAESTLMHELVHKLVKIHDEYNSNIDNCVFYSIKKAYENFPNYPKRCKDLPTCNDCKDENGNKPDCK